MSVLFIRSVGELATPYGAIVLGKAGAFALLMSAGRLQQVALRAAQLLRGGPGSWPQGLQRASDGGVGYWSPRCWSRRPS